VPTADATHTAETAAEPRHPSAAFAEILSIARSAASRQAYYRRALRHIGAFFNTPYAAMYLRFAAEVVEDDFHSGPTDPGFWKDAVQGYLLETLAESAPRAKLLAARDAEIRIAMISVPMHEPQGENIGALALVTRVTTEDARVHVSQLQSLVALVGSAAGLVGASSSSGSASGPAAPNQAIARTATIESVEELAFSITNSLRNKLGCEQVALGEVKNNRLRLVSISGLDEIKPRSPGVVRIRSAMEECLDAGDAIRCDHETDGEARLRHYRLHKQWHDAAHGAAVASIPLRVGDAIAAVISLRRKAAEPFTQEHIEQVRKTVEPFAAAMQLVRNARRGIGRHALDVAREHIATLTGKGHIGRKVATAVSVFGGLWFVFGTLDYAVTAPGRIAPAEGRHIAMPVTGVVTESRVTAGDTVACDEVLCVLDGRELELELEALRAELATIEQQRFAGLADDQPVEARLAATRARMLRAKISMTQRRIEQTTVRSPIDGVVVTGDLRSRLGAVLELGAPLFEIAPLDSLRLEVDVPESAAGNLAVGLTGRFALHARPESVVPFDLTRVRPSSELRGDANVYVTEAAADIDSTWMRPGMEGVARIEIGARPVWWVVFHRAIDGLRLSFWL
jgi:multidrug efflux pump subunit AcrA (membrane-fusion protein)